MARQRWILRDLSCHQVEERYFIAVDEISVIKHVWNEYMDMDNIREIIIDDYYVKDLSETLREHLHNGAPLTDDEMYQLWKWYHTNGEGWQSGNPLHEGHTLTIVPYSEPNFILI